MEGDLYYEPASFSELYLLPSPAFNFPFNCLVNHSELHTESCKRREGCFSFTWTFMVITASIVLYPHAQNFTFIKRIMFSSLLSAIHFEELWLNCYLEH